MADVLMEHPAGEAVSAGCCSAGAGVRVHHAEPGKLQVGITVLSDHRAMIMHASTRDMPAVVYYNRACLDCCSNPVPFLCRTMYQRMQALVKDGTLEHTVNGISAMGRVGSRSQCTGLAVKLENLHLCCRGGLCRT
jgi:hypothetical protein